MVSSWGKSWGISWGNSWGVVEDTPVDAKPVQGYDDRDEQLLALLIPIFMETVCKEAA